VFGDNYWYTNWRSLGVTKRQRSLLRAWRLYCDAVDWLLLAVRRFGRRPCFAGDKRAQYQSATS